MWKLSWRVLGPGSSMMMSHSYTPLDTQRCIFCYDQALYLFLVITNSKGSVCLFFKSKKVLFTGDHLHMDESGLTIMEKYNWFSVPIQLNSVRKLLELNFEWILPGHGRRVQFQSIEEKNAVLEAFLAAKVPDTT